MLLDHVLLGTTVLWVPPVLTPRMMQQVETALWDAIAQTEQESQKLVHLDTSPMPQEIQILLDVNYVQKVCLHI
jgi:hypothetical protein